MESMNAALKEWSALIAALAAGRQVFLLRKGGLAESRAGFKLRYNSFLLFPTFEHQHAQWIRPEFHDLLVPPREGVIAIEYLAEVTDVLPAPAGPERLERAAGHHIWNERFLHMRYAYRSDLPLHLICVRLSRLTEPRLIPDRLSYAGCKSWVHLSEEIDVTRSTPVLDPARYSSALASLRRAFA